MTATRGLAGASAPPRPRPSPLRNLDPVWLLVVNVAVITFMWLRHGGIDRVGSGAEALTALGQLTGLYGAIAVLVGLLLASRTPWLERRYGMDRMIHAHRLTGFTAIWLLSTHVVAIVAGFAFEAKISLWAELVDTVRHHPYVWQALVGFIALIVVAVVSMRAVRRAISYEAWWFVHISVYAAVALAFGHQTAIGSDFVLDRWAWVYWSLLYASVAYLLLVYRWLMPLYQAWRHRFRVSGVVPEAPGVVTIEIGGRDLDRFPVQAGQFFLLRTLRRHSWWKAHPFSLSAVPSTSGLRFTVKALGDDTAALQSVAIGTPIALEGPYGGFLAFLPVARPMLFIAGGVGITPFRGMIDDLDDPGRVALLYRNPTPDDAIFRDDLVRLSAEKGFDLHLSYSRGGEENPFAPENLTARFPDLVEREVFVIGSSRLIDAARSGLRAAGVPAGRIHLENFAY